MCRVVANIEEQAFKNGVSEISLKQPLKKFKGCPSQILLSSFLNTLSHMKLSTEALFKELMNNCEFVTIF